MSFLNIVIDDLSKIFISGIILFSEARVYVIIGQFKFKFCEFHYNSVLKTQFCKTEEWNPINSNPGINMKIFYCSPLCFLLFIFYSIIRLLYSDETSHSIVALRYIIKNIYPSPWPLVISLAILSRHLFRVLQRLISSAMYYETPSFLILYVNSTFKHSSLVQHAVQVYLPPYAVLDI